VCDSPIRPLNNDGKCPPIIEPVGGTNRSAGQAQLKAPPICWLKV
jgi:hypothetical protein